MLQARMGRHETHVEGQAPGKTRKIFGPPPTPSPKPLPAGFKPPFKLQENVPLYKCFKPFTHHFSGFMFVPPRNKKPGMVSISLCSSACWQHTSLRYMTTKDQELFNYPEAGYEDAQSFYVVPGASSGTVSFKSGDPKESDKFLVIKSPEGVRMSMQKVEHAKASYTLNECPMVAPWGELPMGKCVALHQIDAWSIYVHFEPAINGSKDHVSFGSCTGKQEHPRDTPQEYYFQMMANFYSKPNNDNKGQMLSAGAKPGNFVKGDSTDKAALTRASFRVVKGVQPDEGNTFSFIDWQGRYLTGNHMLYIWGDKKGLPAKYLGIQKESDKFYHKKGNPPSKQGFWQSYVVNTCCPIYEKECAVKVKGPAYKFTPAPTPAPPTAAPTAAATKPAAAAPAPTPEGGCDCD